MSDIVTSLRAHHGSAYMCQDCYGTQMDEAADEIERLRNIIRSAMQRLNESGTGEMGVVETIHATHDILRGASS